MIKKITVSEQFLRDTYEYLTKYAKEHPKNTDVLILVGYAWAALNLADDPVSFNGRTLR